MQVSSLKMLKYSQKLSKTFIEKYYRDEIMFFDNIWEIYEPELNRLIEFPFEKWHFKIPKYKLMGALGFSYSAKVEELITPKIIQVIFAALFKLKKLQGVLSEKTVEETIDKCGEDLPGSLRSQTVSYFAPLIQKDLEKIGRIPAIEVEEEKKYVMYSHKNKKGNEITESKYLELIETNKDEYSIWIDEISSIFIIDNKNIEKVGANGKKVLKLLIKGAGRVLSFRELIKNINPLLVSPAFLDEKNEWDNYYNKNVYYWLSDLRKDTDYKIDDYIKKVRGSGYKLKTEKEFKFCLIDKIAFLKG